MTVRMVGRYHLKEEIGRGGMATVYSAFDPNFNREVAIKLLPRAMMHDPRFRARFKKELRMISSLEHSAIVPVYDSGVYISVDDDSGEEDGQPYFVMRYMAGGSLSQLLKGGRLSLQKTAEIIERIASALDYAHQKGIVHRDLKPDNILFDSSHTPHLSDFGVAKLSEAAHSDTGTDIVGTPAYVSPEQASGENDKVDSRSDIYGLGVLAYQMLTGEQPFKAETKIKVYLKHINEPVPNILNANPDLPSALETIINKAMAKKKEKRYQSVLEFAHALSVAAFGPDRTVPRALVLERRHFASLSRRKKVFVGFGAILLIVLAGLVYFPPKSLSQPASTSTLSLIPSLTHTIAATNTSISTVPPPTGTPDPILEIPTLIPTPNGGADRIALLSGNVILSMNLDGSNQVTLNDDNFNKSNLQWINTGQLVYISPTRNCAYMGDVENQRFDQIMCFTREEELEGFRVSPDGTYVAISVDGNLYIVPFDVELLKTKNTRHLLETMTGRCHYSLPVKDVRWSNDGRRIAALVVDTKYAGSDQINLFEIDLSKCNSPTLRPTDRFPADLFPFGSTIIPSYDWDGDHLFLLNDFIRNDGFGNLYIYDSISREGKKINPIADSCCYRDARWSPDGKYILFLYQNEFGSDIKVYYILASDLDGEKGFVPIENILSDLFNPRDKPEPALRSAK